MSPSEPRYVHKRAGTPGSDEPMSGLGDLALFLGGGETSFVGQLLQLVQKADPDNLSRLALGYPEVVRAWQVWHYLGSPTADQLAAALEADVNTNGAIAAGYLTVEPADDGETRYRLTAAGIENVLNTIGGGDPE